MYELPMCMHPCSALTLPASSVEHSAPVWHSKFFSEMALSVLLVLLGHLIQREGAVSSLCVHCELKVHIPPCGLCIVHSRCASVHVACALCKHVYSLACTAIAWDNDVPLIQRQLT